MKMAEINIHKLPFERFSFFLNECISSYKKKNLIVCFQKRNFFSEGDKVWKKPIFMEVKVCLKYIREKKETDGNQENLKRYRQAEGVYRK